MLFRYLMSSMLLIFCSSLSCKGQSRLLTLAEATSVAKQKSIMSQQALALRRTNYWKYRLFLANYKPQLSLDGVIPAFTRSYVEVTQPDGTIAFQAISNNNSALTLSLSQNVGLTGGNLYIQKQLQRFDNFLDRNTIYNGIPFSVGYSQPLFKFNPMRWERKIAPLLYEESQQQFIESIEQVALNTVTRYFDLLIAQTNLRTAKTNLINSDTLLKIAEKKIKEGRLSQNDFLQLKLSALTAKKDLAVAEQTTQISSLALKSYIGYREDDNLELIIPTEVPDLAINEEKAIDEATNNRASFIAFRRRLLESDSDLDKASKENRFNATLDVAFGLSNRGSTIADIYKNPQDREYAQVKFTLPILTWGRAKASIETAKANQQFTQQSIDQEKLTIQQEVKTQLLLIQMLAQQVVLAVEADKIAQERYQIAQNRFLLSDLSVTDLGIATQEKDRATRDVVITFRSYWETFFTIRMLTLFDFVKNEKITPSEL